MSENGWEQRNTPEQQWEAVVAVEVEKIREYRAWVDEELSWIEEQARAESLDYQAQLLDEHSQLQQEIDLHVLTHRAKLVEQIYTVAYADLSFEIREEMKRRTYLAFYPVIHYVPEEVLLEIDGEMQRAASFVESHPTLNNNNRE
ncbi:MAG: hypothetical protein AAF614_41595 [Chloroflexota bacterium]